MQNTNLYFKELLLILSQIENLTIEEKNDIWLKRYFELIDDINKKNLEALPKIIALIHPDFLVDNKGQEIGYLIKHDRSNFNEAITDSDSCQISTIADGSICEFNNYRHLRRKCHADHFWPYSLGGPTILENRVLLCRFHNVAKSNSITNQFWKLYPEWLNDYLGRIFNFKQ